MDLLHKIAMTVKKINAHKELSMVQEKPKSMYLKP